MNFKTKTALEIADLCQRRECSVLEVIEYFLDRAKEEKSNGMAIKLREHALKQAKKMDETYEKKLAMSKPLYGVPFANKAIFCAKNIEINAGSRALQGFKPMYSATIVERLDNAGAIMIGISNTDEFAMGIKTNSAVYGQTVHPSTTNLKDHVFIGGSSGGSASVVSEGLALLSTGSDTGGSTRLPASLCGLFGLKASYGRISRNGMIAFSNSFDHPGLITRSLADLAMALQIVSGKDYRDQTSSSLPVSDFKNICEGPKNRMKIAVISTKYIPDHLSNQVKSVANKLQKIGHQIEEINLDEYLKFSEVIYPILTYTEAMSNMARYDTIRYGTHIKSDSESHYSSRANSLGAEVRRRIAIGKYILSKDKNQLFLRAQQMRAKIIRHANQIFSKFDAAILPTSHIGARSMSQLTDLDYTIFDVLVMFSNASGIPTVSIPILKDIDQSPIGLQVLSGRFLEDKMFAISAEICSKNTLV